jgi:hypothetical protein
LQEFIEADKVLDNHLSRTSDVFVGHLGTVIGTSGLDIAGIHGRKFSQELTLDSWRFDSRIPVFMLNMEMARQKY